MLDDQLPSSPPQGASPEETIAYYKTQYEQLESELADFQASSQELEAELEKDVEAAEKRERHLQEKVESLGFEVEEWKTKYKQSKSEANAAQNLLQKEITTLRDTTRGLQLTLRDIEVQNDDFEKQARNTTSSLEDLESKYNVGIERAVMLEEEIKIGEQERENLRIETQRLRDELSDLKIEAEIMGDKLRKRQNSTLTTDIRKSPARISSPASVASSPMISTPPDTVSISTTDSLAARTPPSPPISETSSAKAKQTLRTPVNPSKSKLKLPTGNSSTTPKPLARAPSSHIRSPRGPGGASVTTSATRTRNATPSVIRNVARTKAPATRGLPNSTSLTHIRSLTAQMQRLELRVQSARSKLPAPVTTPPHTSPRAGSAMGQSYMPPSVTIRSRKRTVGSTASSVATTSTTASDTPGGPRHVSRASTSGISRLSFGPVANREGESRPSSRISNNFVRADRPLSRTELARPASRASLSGARTPLGHYSQSTIAESRRPRSSIGGNYAASYGHGHSQSVSHVDLDEDRELDFSTPTRRITSRSGEVEIPPIPSNLPRRKSGVTGLPRRTSHGPGDGSMKPPLRKLSGVGETY